MVDSPTKTSPRMTQARPSVSVRLDTALLHDLDTLASRKRVTRSFLVEAVLRDYAHERLAARVDKAIEDNRRADIDILG